MRKLLTALLALTTISTVAQSPVAPPPASPGWQKIQALHAGSSIKVVARLQSTSCKLKSVDADTLTCTHGKDIVFQRTDISTIKVPRRGRSATVGLLIGAGVGAGVGALSGGCKAGSFCIVSRGASTIILAIPGIAIGAAVGALTDFTRSTIYKAP
jgi:hypothetical protein